MSAIERAVKKAGGQQALADICGVKYQAVQKWINNGVPAERVLMIETATGVSRHELRPDIYPIDKGLSDLRIHS